MDNEVQGERTGRFGGSPWQAAGGARTPNTGGRNANPDCPTGARELYASYGARPAKKSEVINSDYGFATYGSYGKGNARIRFPTDYAKANYAWQRTDDGFGGYWWLRSPHYSESDGVRGVSYGGDAHLGSYVDITYYGVVPALSISF